MADLIVTFGRIVGPVMGGRNCRTEAMLITSPAEVSDMVCDPSDNFNENVADLLAGADCWVEIGASPVAAAPGSDPSDSFKMLSGERVQRSIVKGDRVSVISA